LKTTPNERHNRTCRASATNGSPDGWVTATGAHSTKVGGTNGEPGFRADQYGFLAGLDQKAEDYTLGIATGYAHADIEEHGAP
jgi:outer membrane autotransporter protein